MTMLDDAVICEPLRTPVGRFGGMLRDVSPSVLAATVVRELVARTGVSGDGVDDVIFGQCYPNGDAPAIGRVAALDAGLAVDVPGLQIDRRCGSSLQAVIFAAMQVQTGAAELVIAGGAESMSRVELYSSDLRWGSRGGAMLHDRLQRSRITAGGEHYPVPGGMIETAENLRREYGIGREEQDEYALESHVRASTAQHEGRFVDEIVPVSVLDRKRSATTSVSVDEGPRAEVSLERLAALPPVMGATDSEATVTSGNACGQNDAASACLVTTREQALKRGLRPLARLVTWAVAGVPPRTMGIGPVASTARALQRADLSLVDIDLIELNEAFAAQVLACTREWGFAAADFQRLNVNGSGISLGHPVGATGTRILATLLREMQRREAHYGIETMCIGGGQGLTAIFEREPD